MVTEKSAKKWLQHGLFKQNKDGKDFLCATAEERDAMIAKCILNSRTKQGKMLQEKSFQNIFSQLKAYGVDILGDKAFVKSRQMYVR